MPFPACLFHQIVSHYDCCWVVIASACGAFSMQSCWAQGRDSGIAQPADVRDQCHLWCGGFPHACVTLDYVALGLLITSLQPDGSPQLLNHILLCFTMQA